MVPGWVKGIRLWQLATLLGVAVFVWVGYMPSLDPTDLDWIALDDPFCHVMGWEQFRNAPLLQYPITQNAQYGLEWSSSIVFSDSIPLVAIPLRPLSGLLPVPFQYLGWWTLLSFVLQAYWGGRLVQLRARRLGEVALGAALFVTAPTLLNRIGLQSALASHWILLWALWLYLSSRGARPVVWTCVLLVAVSVHAYLFVMVGAIWAAHVVACATRRLMPRRDVALTAAGIVVVLAWMHALGYFAIGGGAASGGGISRFDLTSFVSGSLFTTLMPQLPEVNWDGNAFLGTGMLVALVASGVVSIYRRGRAVDPAPSAEMHAPWWPLLVVVIGLALFAITTTVMVAGKPVLELPVPGVLQKAYQTFRGAARMIWPAYYLIVLGTIWLVLRNTTRRSGWIVLAVALVTQVIDLRVGAAFKASQLHAGSLVEELRHPVWTELPRQYKHLVSVPAYHAQPHRTTFAWFAARNDMGSNIGYFSRTDASVRKAGARRHLSAVLGGDYEPSTVYYLPNPELWMLARRAAGPDDVALIADGHHLLLPGGRTWWPHTEALPPLAEPALGTWISFAVDGTGRALLTEGWSWQESWGLWSADPEPTLVVPAPPHERVRISLRWLATAPPGKAQRLRLHIDGTMFDVQFEAGGSERVDTFEVTSHHHFVDVRIEVLHPVLAVDQRTLGVGLIAAKVDRL